jgi:Rrf2 family iron-sulfur cluster assembly transcriptional regulator
MRITQWGEYGILCSAFIARKVTEGCETVTATEISADQNIPVDYTRQILQRLKQGSVISTVRGPHGGYRLTRPAGEITLSDILHAAEGDTFEIICEKKPINSERCGSGMPCNLKDIWYGLRDHIENFLKNYTLEDLLKLPPDESPTIQIGGHATDHA